MTPRMALIGAFLLLAACAQNTSEDPTSLEEDALGAVPNLPPGSTARTTASVNLRSGPGTRHRILDVLSPGTIVVIRSRSGVWYRVDTMGETGWVSGHYLRAVHTDAGMPPSPDAGADTPDAGSALDSGPSLDAGPALDAGTGSGLWDPRSGPPPKKGIWIWYFAYTGMTAQDVAIQSQQDGIGYVLIKSGQDSSFWTTRYNEDIVREFTSRGITVFAWPYMTPSNIQGSIDAAVRAANVPGTAGVILDVEMEWEGGSASTHHQAALDLCNGIRRGAPNVFLGYTSFGWIGYHSSFPFSAFDQACGDVFMAQVYWTDRGVAWQHGYQQALDMYGAAQLHAPIWMSQSNDATPSGVRPSTADLNAFFDQAGATSALWEWPASGHQSLVDQLQSLHWSNP